MSFLSVVKRSNVSSIVGVSVFGSTTRKFFCESGGAVTCCFTGLGLVICFASNYSHQFPRARGL